MDGIVVVNKPTGITSYDVIRRLKKLFDTKKIGHGGTLDPFAGGVLVIAVNRATKIIKYFLNGDKSYIAKLKFGEMTDTHDLTGSVIKAAGGANVTKEELLSVLKEFIGETNQLPPMYSAKKIGGVKLYKMARDGVEIERDKVTIFINDIELIELSYPYATIRVDCKKGTYIRSLANDIGIRLSVYAHLVELNRTKSCPFDIKDAHDIDELAGAKDEGRIGGLVISMNDALSFMPAVRVKSGSINKVKHGICLTDEDVEPPDVGVDPYKDGEESVIKLLSEDDELLAIAGYTDDTREYKYKRVLIK